MAVRARRAGCRASRRWRWRACGTRATCARMPRWNGWLCRSSLLSSLYSTFVNHLVYSRCGEGVKPSVPVIINTYEMIAIVPYSR